MMLNRFKTNRIFIEADSIAVKKMSGIGHTTLETIRALDDICDDNKNKYDISIIVPSGLASYVKEYGFRNIRIRTIPRGYKYINYLITRTPIPIPMDLWFGRGIYIFPNYKNWWVPFSKSITYVHDIAFKKYPETVHPKNLKYLASSIDRWLSRTDVIVTVSGSSAKEIGECFPAQKDKLKVVYNGVNPKEYYPRSSKEIKDVTKKYNLPKDYFLYVGNMEPRKNILTMLDAYKLYADSTDTMARPFVLISGGGWNSELIYRHIDKMLKDGYKIVNPQEYVEDVDLPAVYSAAFAVIHVAIHEGFGLPPLQGLACGTPALVSDIPAFREILDCDGVMFANPNNPKEISECMTELESTGNNDGLIKNYTWDKSAINLLGIADTI